MERGNKRKFRRRIADWRVLVELRGCLYNEVLRIENPKGRTL